VRPRGANEAVIAYRASGRLGGRKDRTGPDVDPPTPRSRIAPNIFVQRSSPRPLHRFATGKRPTFRSRLPCAVRVT
jgi:hypothetical protein